MRFTKCSIVRSLVILIVGLGSWLCMPRTAAAQSPAPPVATASQAFGFDYKDADLTTFSVIRFEMQMDAGAFVSVNLPIKASDALTPVGSSTYKVPIPALTTGSHVVSFRACNAQLCGDSSAPFTFILAVKPATPTGTRVLGS